MELNSLVAIIKGETYNLTLGSDGYYTIELPAGSASSFCEEGGFFPVELIATDKSTPPLSTTITPTHSKFGENLKLYVCEEVKPEITILTPGENGYITNNSKPEIKFTIKDNGSQPTGFSGIDTSKIELKIDGVLVPVNNLTVELSTDKSICTCTYTPNSALNNGDHTITINAKDNDGNSAVTATRTFEIDITAPTLNISNPANGMITSVSTLVVEGYVDDDNKPIDVEIVVNGGTPDVFTVEASNGHFTRSVNLEAGDNVIQITAIDNIDNRSVTQTFTVKYNSTAPIFSDVEILYNGSQVSASNKVPTTGSYTIRCKVTTAQ